MEFDFSTDTITPDSGSLNIGSLILNTNGSIDAPAGVQSNGLNYLTLPDIGAVTKDPTGFVNRVDSIYSFTNNTRTFSILPVSTSYDIYHKGTKITKTSTDDIVIPDTEGMYFIYFDGTGTLQYLSGFDVTVITDQVYVCNLYWDATNNICVFIGDERHGIMMDSTTHQYLHLSRGAIYISGFALQNFVPDGDGTLNTHAQFDVSSGTFYDEDIQFQHNATTQIPVFYKTGSSGHWRVKDADSYPIIYSGSGGYTGANGRLPYNRFNAGSWSLTELSSNNSYVLMHYLAINDISLKIMGVVGTTEYASITDARLGANNELESLTGLPFQEFIPIGTVIFQSSSTFTNAPKSIVISTDLGLNYVDYRTTRGYRITGFAGSHSLLDDVDKDDHLQYFNITRGDARYQPLDSDLTSIASISTTGVITRTGSGTSLTRTMVGNGNRITVANGDGVSGNPTFDVGSDVVLLTATQTLTNKTLISPRIETSLLDTNGNEYFVFSATSSAVNEFTITNAATTGLPTLSVSGGDTNISMNLVAKGTGTINANGRGVLNFDPAYSVNAAGTPTTTSLTDVLVPNMSITPGAGTYKVSFNSCIFNSSNAALTYISIYANGTQVVNSERHRDGKPDIFVSLEAIVTVGAGQAIEIRWRTTTGTASVENRIMTLLRIG